MQRRDFITLVGCAALTWPLATRAQQPKVARIGALYIGVADEESFKRGLRQGMSEKVMSKDVTSPSSFVLRKAN